LGKGFFARILWFVNLGNGLRGIKFETMVGGAKREGSRNYKRRILAPNYTLIFFKDSMFGNMAALSYESHGNGKNDYLLTTMEEANSPWKLIHIYPFSTAEWNISRRKWNASSSLWRPWQIRWIL